MAIVQFVAGVPARIYWSQANPSPVPDELLFFWGTLPLTSHRMTDADLGDWKMDTGGNYYQELPDAGATRAKYLRAMLSAATRSQHGMLEVTWVPCDGFWCYPAPNAAPVVVDTPVAGPAGGVLDPTWERRDDPMVEVEPEVVYTTRADKEEFIRTGSDSFVEHITPNEAARRRDAGEDIVRF